MSCPFEHDAGSYVLGALSPEERVAFERHLGECDACTREVRELAGLPGLLARIPVEVLDPDELPLPVPDTLLPTVVRRIHRTRRRRAWAVGGLVAAAAVVAFGGVAVALAAHDDDAAPVAGPSAPTAAASTSAPEALLPVGTQPVTGWVSLTQVGWGTRVDLTCAYSGQGGDYHDGTPTYTMYVTKTDGSTEQVASWKVLPGKTMHLAAATAAERDDITNVVVKAPDGHAVLELTS